MAAEESVSQEMLKLKNKLIARTMALHHALEFLQNDRTPTIGDINQIRRSLGWHDLEEKTTGRS